MPIQAPIIDWGALAPLLIIFTTAVIAVLVEAFVPRQARRSVQMVLTLVAIAAALITVIYRWVAMSAPTSVLGGALQEDHFTLAAQAIVLIFALLSVMVVTDRTSVGDGAFVAAGATVPGSAHEEVYTRAGFAVTEIYPLLLFSLGGMMVFPATGDLVTLFIALEVLSLPLYILCGLARRRRLLSQEASLKYFLLGAFSSAFMLFGIALVYGFAGSFRYADILQAVITLSGGELALVAGVVLILIGLLFKVGAVPFHTWTPDVYQGAPTPITGFMAAATKLAAFAAMVRFIYTVAYPLQWDLLPFLLAVIILTMLLGTVLGIIQGDMKRMLAYSSIAHAGFILMGVVALEERAIGAVLFYLLVYGIATIGAFAMISIVREVDQDGTITAEATGIDQWKGLGKRHPLLALAMTIFLLSFAGIPLTAGFIGKFVVFSTAVSAGYGWLVVLAVIASAATAFFYVRVIVMMYLEEATERTVVATSEGPAVIAIGIATIATVVLGIIPNIVLTIAQTASKLLP
ncbi:MAG: NADH-quinone oxidoreductase subunit NuoN [Bowdeniella nasicola]|nr:NADH-quinone oxidoreductase subunit NuoN [Bowdeniella nasicola]